MNSRMRFFSLLVIVAILLVAVNPLFTTQSVRAAEPWPVIDITPLPGEAPGPEDTPNWVYMHTQEGEVGAGDGWVLHKDYGNPHFNPGPGPVLVPAGAEWFLCPEGCEEGFVFYQGVVLRMRGLKRGDTVVFYIAHNNPYSTADPREVELFENGGYKGTAPDGFEVVRVSHTMGEDGTLEIVLEDSVGFWGPWLEESYIPCSETVRGEEFRREGPFADIANKRLYWLVTYERLDAYNPLHFCGEETVEEDIFYLECTDVGEPEMVYTTSWYYNPTIGEYQMDTLYRKYDIWFHDPMGAPDVFCDEFLVHQYHGTCRPEHTETVPEDERGEFTPVGEAWQDPITGDLHIVPGEEVTWADPETGVVYNILKRPLTRDDEARVPCSWEDLFVPAGDECSPDRTEVIPEGDRSEWIDTGKTWTDPETGKAYKILERPFTRDRLTGTCCSYEEQYELVEEPVPPPRDKTYVSTVMPDSAIGKAVRYYMVAGGYDKTHIADWDQWRRAAVLDIFWVPLGEEWPLGIELPASYQVTDVYKDGSPMRQYDISEEGGVQTVVFEIEPGHQYQVVASPTNSG